MSLRVCPALLKWESTRTFLPYGVCCLFEMSDAGKAAHTYRGNRKKGSFKQQIRGVERYLKRTDISEESRFFQTKKLEELKKALNSREQVDKEKKRAKQYHGIKFFEKKKVMRKLKQLRKRREKGDAADNSVLLEELEAAEDNLAYIIYFPKGKKYVSLFPSKDADNKDMLAKRAKLLVEAKKNKQTDEKKKAAGQKGDYSDDDDMDKDHSKDVLLDEKDDFFLTEEEPSKASSDSKNKKKRARQEETAKSKEQYLATKAHVDAIRHNRKGVGFKKKPRR